MLIIDLVLDADLGLVVALVVLLSLMSIFIKPFPTNMVFFMNPHAPSMLSAYTMVVYCLPLLIKVNRDWSYLIEYIYNTCYQIGLCVCKCISTTICYYSLK